MASIVPPEHRNTVLYGLAAVLAVQVPTTISAIPDPRIRAAFQIVILLLVILVAGRIKPPPPPPAIPVQKVPDVDPITIPDRPYRQFSRYVA